ncbi:uncharacterized protein [Zea mays]|uniref:uncharacterized protein isoform X2 n=1 Tax=Zea mays TaxID=4577 RepID=UPI0009A9CF6A|nr:uncharacterized protein LOC118476008 isoform X2 [Zea mays]
MELDAPPPAAAVAIPPAGSDKHKGFERMKFARAGSEPLAKIQMHHSKMNPRIMRMGHRRSEQERAARFTSGRGQTSAESC